MFKSVQRNLNIDLYFFFFIIWTTDISVVFKKKKKVKQVMHVWFSRFINKNINFLQYVKYFEEDAVCLLIYSPGYRERHSVQIL